MEFGWLDVCLRVRDVVASRQFYEGLGFRKVEGEDDEGWAVVVKDEARLGLFEPQHMEGANFSLNFRGGHVGEIVEYLKGVGYEFARAAATPSGSGSAVLKDPDGTTIFFDSSAGETKKT